MQGFKKVNRLVMASVVGGAVVAGGAGSASAFENEFHAAYTLRAIASNFDDGSCTPLGSGIGGYSSGTNGVFNKAKSLSSEANQAHDGFLTEQRVRLNYTGKASDDLRLVSQFDISFLFGQGQYMENYQNAGLKQSSYNDGGGLGGGEVNLKTKALYIDSRIENTPIRFKVGLQPFTDPYKGTILSNVAAGIVSSYETDKFELQAGWFRLHAVELDYAKSGSSSYSVQGGKYIDPNTGLPFDDTWRTDDFYLVQGKYRPTPAVTVGASFYAWQSDWKSTFNSGTGAGSVNPSTGTAAATTGITPLNQDDLELYYAGLNGEYKFGKGGVVDGFFVYNFGQRLNHIIKEKQHVSAFETSASVRVPVGPDGLVRSTFIYTSGDNSLNGKRRTDFGGVVNVDGMPESYFTYPQTLMLFTSQVGAVTNRNVLHSVANEGTGIWGGFLGYDHNFTKKIFGSVNVGAVAAVKDPFQRAGNYIGTEYSGEVGYKVNTNTTIRVQGGTVLLGDYYKGTASEGNGKDPSNPYTARFVLSYLF
ncbi:hypothetical protein [Geomesophilobacter sediminis]|uniref:Uncharacterized protein n=1 Tax=Geomesophilobacter sediminis TaxID=2798584 RepID=A0A8J7JC78_9BACT|nr:hypothetical protein [Geomesophilobacter sediminis]MBJ6724328.1 hypothetical protein [Geomesophilobacter sediminis]